MRLLLCLAFLAVVTPSLQQASNSTTNSTSGSNVTVAPTEKPIPLDCPARCARIYRPVCAWVRGKRHTYANICLMRSDINCARRRGVAARYRIRFIRQGHCNSRSRRRPSRGGRRPRPNRRPSTGGKAVNSRVLNSNS